jgi:hypothetical protein
MHKRPHSVGNLRPSIVLYNEPHKDGDRIGQAVSRDLGGRTGQERSGADLLLVVGTSLKVPGTMQMVKDFARFVHSGTSTVSSRTMGVKSTFGSSNMLLEGPLQGAPAPTFKTIYLNKEFPSLTSSWEGVFDVWVQGDAQILADMLHSKMENEVDVRKVVVKKRKRQVDDGQVEDGRKTKTTAISNKLMATPETADSHSIINGIDSLQSTDRVDSSQIFAEKPKRGGRTVMKRSPLRRKRRAQTRYDDE